MASLLRSPISTRLAAARSQRQIPELPNPAPPTANPNDQPITQETIQDVQQQTNQQQNLSATNIQTEMAEQSVLQQTFQEMVTQLSGATLSSALIHITPPTFSGAPNEDIHDWVERFEQLTFSLPQEQKNLLLDKAFMKAARAWFREELRPTLAATEWNTVKRQILEHFSGKSPQVRAYEKLMQLTYRPDRHASILYYIDEYTYLYKQAYPIHQQSEVVRAVVLSLPQNIKSKLNYMQDLSAINTVETLKKLAKRYDQEGVEEPAPRGPVDIEEFNKSLREAVKELAQQQIAATKEVVAAIIGQQASTNSETESPDDEHVCLARSQPRYQQNSDFRTNQQGFRNQPICQCQQSAYRARPNNGYAAYRNDRPTYRDPSPRYRNNQQLQREDPRYPQPNGGYNNRNEPAPPSPCFTCGGDHWNRQCPRRKNNLN